MSAAIRAKATAALLDDLIEHLRPDDVYDLRVRWGLDFETPIIDAVVAKMRAERAEAIAAASEEAREDAEALRAWLAELTGMPAKVRHATPRVLQAKARTRAPWSLHVSVKGARPAEGKRLVWVGLVWVPGVAWGAAEPCWHEHSNRHAPAASPAEAVAAALDDALAAAETGDRDRAALERMAAGLRATACDHYDDTPGAEGAAKETGRFGPSGLLGLPPDLNERICPPPQPGFPSEQIRCDRECGFTRAGFGWRCNEGTGCGRFINYGEPGCAELTAYYDAAAKAERI